MFGIFKRRPKPNHPLTFDRIVEVFRSYHAVVAVHALDLDAAGIMDETLLPCAKVEILDVLCVYLAMEEQGRDHESVVALAADLASFQPGVGSQPVFPKEEGLRRLATGPMNAKVFTDAYDLIEAEAERYSRLQPMVSADLRSIADRCAKARAKTSRTVW